jgi:hypothetical protein
VVSSHEWVRQCHSRMGQTMSVTDQYFKACINHIFTDMFGNSIVFLFLTLLVTLSSLFNFRFQVVLILACERLLKHSGYPAFKFLFLYAYLIHYFACFQIIEAVLSTIHTLRHNKTRCTLTHEICTLFTTIWPDHST